jgi:hypothetical protein
VEDYKKEKNMPYIKQEQRDKLDAHIYGLLYAIESDLKDSTKEFDPVVKGLLNYCFTKIIVQLLKDSGELSYSKINDLIGVLECCKLEQYRRLSFYENKKIIENGDVFDGLDVKI